MDFALGVYANCTRSLHHQLSMAGAVIMCCLEGPVGGRNGLPQFTERGEESWLETQWELVWEEAGEEERRRHGTDPLCGAVREASKDILAPAAPDGNEGGCSTLAVVSTRLVWSTGP
jgi:hypothetical protein